MTVELSDIELDGETARQFEYLVENVEGPDGVEPTAEEYAADLLSMAVWSQYKSAIEPDRQHKR